VGCVGEHGHERRTSSRRRQVIDLYGGRAWRATIRRAVYVVCLTAIVVTLLWRLL
jgi:hypothetical protein